MWSDLKAVDILISAVDIKHLPNYMHPLNNKTIHGFFSQPADHIIWVTIYGSEVRKITMYNWVALRGMHTSRHLIIHLLLDA